MSRPLSTRALVWGASFSCLVSVLASTGISCLACCGLVTEAPAAGASVGEVLGDALGVTAAAKFNGLGGMS